MNIANHKPDNNFKYFLKLMQSVLNGTPVELPNKQVDWQLIYDIAAAHSLGGMLYEAIRLLPEELQPQGEFMPYLKQMYQEQIVADLNLTLETERMISLLNSRGIRCLPLKGMILKEDYPQAYLRSMADVDILCEKGFRRTAEEIFIEEGYEKENVGIKDTSFRKNGIFHYELHGELVTSDSPAYDYFSKIWERLKSAPDSVSLSMSLEDTYIYLLEHLAGHIGFGGAGVRMYMDVYVFLTKHGDALDRDYVNKILNQILLSNFEKVTLKTCKNLFSGKEKIDINSEAVRFIYNSCTFGKTEMAFLYDTVKNRKGKGKTQNGVYRVLNKLFPPVELMRARYSAVDKFLPLYPIFVLVHWFDRAFISRNISTSNLKDYFIVDTSENAQNAKSFFLALGLQERMEYR